MLTQKFLLFSVKKRKKLEKKAKDLIAED
jgi:hypothetical protein